jgi:hypothetical protein
MQTIVLRFRTSQQGFENKACADSNRSNRLNVSWRYMQQFTIYSIWAVIWYLQKTIDISGCALLRLGNV